MFLMTFVDGKERMYKAKDHECWVDKMNQAMNLSLHQALFAYNCSREHVSERTERTNLAGSEKPSQSSGQACLTASPDVESLFAGYITARVDKRLATNGTRNFICLN